MELDWAIDADAGVAFVRIHLRNPTPVARRVRVENRLRGPLLAPRRSGVPERGWDETGYETVVPTGERRAVGYACPASPRELPVELVRDEHADPEGATADPDPDRDADVAAAAAIRRLGDPRPPRDAVAAPSDGSRRTDAVADAVDRYDDADGDSFAGDRPRDRESPATPIVRELDAAARRIHRAERLTAPSVATATEPVAAAGGLDGVAALAARVDADAERLRSIADRATALADRAERTDVPLDALRELA